MTRTATKRALFQARKTILMGWKSATPLTVKSWIEHTGDTLIQERYIYQHRGSPGKFEKLWGPMVGYTRN